jgi:internalin A
MMILVLLLGAGLGWIVHIIHKARLQRDAVAAIEREGGMALYDWEWKDGTFHRGRPWWPRRLEKLIGIDYLSNVVYVSFDDGISDAKLEMVGCLPRLETLDYFESSATDAGLAHLQGLTRLKNLDLHDSEVTDAGLVHLEGLTGLQELDLSSTPITDAGLVHLEGLTGLRTLSLANTEVSEAGVVHFKKLTDLRFLDLARTKIDNYAAQELRRALPRAKVGFTSIQAR